jgi:putative transposase
MEEQLKEVLGATFSNPTERGDYPSDEKAVLTREDAERWLANYLWGEYPNQKHDGIGMTPLEKLAEGQIMSRRKLGGGEPRICTNPKRLRIDLLPIEYVAVHDYGFQIDYRRYYHPLLDYWIYNEPHRQHIIRRNTDMISYVDFFDPRINDYEPIPLSRVLRQEYTEEEWRDAKEYCRQKGYPLNEDAIFRAREELDKIQTEAQWKKKQAGRRTNERRVEAERRREREKRRSDSILPTNRTAPAETVLDHPSNVSDDAATTTGAPCPAQQTLDPSKIHLDRIVRR